MAGAEEKKGWYKVVARVGYQECLLIYEKSFLRGGGDYICRGLSVLVVTEHSKRPIYII